MTAKRHYDPHSGEVEWIDDDPEPRGCDHWLVSGRIDGLREALTLLLGSINFAEAEQRIEARINEMMNTTP